MPESGDASSKAPPLGWTRGPALVLLALGALVTAPIVVQLFFDTGCPSHPTPPHVGEGLVLAAAAAVSALLGFVAHAALVGWVSRVVRLRSTIAGVVIAALTVAPALVMAIADAALAAFFYFQYVFHLCLDGVFWFGGC